MGRKRRRILILGVSALVALAPFPICSGNVIAVDTDWLWSDTLGQLSTFDTRLVSRVVLWLATGLSPSAVLAGAWFLHPRRLLGRPQVAL